jgi:hypothetical protein
MSVKFRYTGSAPAFSPHVGDVEPGGSYEVPAHLVPRFERAEDWEPVNSPKSDAPTRVTRPNRKV